MRRGDYFAVGVLVCALTGAPGGDDARKLRSADLPGPAWHTVAGPPAAPGWTAQRRAALPAAAPQMPGRFELVGHNALMNRGMNAALAVHGRYAYVGSRTDGSHLNSGVLVVDVGNPVQPEVVHQIGMPDEANLGESSRELRILPDQSLLLVLNHGCSELIHACVNLSQAGETIAPSRIAFYDIAGENAAAPKLVGTYVSTRQSAQSPHEFFLWSDPKRPGRTLLYETTPSSDSSGQASLYVVDLSQARANRYPEIASWKNRIGNPQRDNRLHSLTISADGRRAYLAYLGGGFLVADTSDFADAQDKPEMRLITPVDKRVFWTDPGAHSAIQIPGKPWVMTTDEVYGRLGGLLGAHGCPWGWVRFIDIRDAAAPRLASELRPPWNRDEACENVDDVRNNFASFSAHNPTLTPNVALITWHSAGFLALDISNPEQPSIAAQYLPEPLPFVATEDPALSSGNDKVVMWSFPVVQNGLVYVVDLRNGLYVFRYHGPHEGEVAGVGFLDGNSSHGDIQRFEREAAERAAKAKKKKKSKRAKAKPRCRKASQRKGSSKRSKSRCRKATRRRSSG